MRRAGRCPDPRPGLSKLPFPMPHLSKADLTSQLSKDSYRELLEAKEDQSFITGPRLRIPVVLVYEGWDVRKEGTSGG